MRHLLRSLLLASTWVALLPGLAAACAVCMTGKDDETRAAFGWMTAFMSIIPFVLGGGVLWWLRSRLKEIESMHERAQKGAQAAEPERAQETGSATIHRLDAASN